ncbi:flagellar protein FlgN [Halalkalibacillus halophilus]|uniref:flagellar protein FlgN n=1 Tax=Halalkalibacillus halophilus TaxID=392827 RepID=UPI000415BEA6|nr:flagellar protein FlgN [Halalkalibacillus halophilus]
MSTEKIIARLDKLHQLNISLLNLSKEKTERLKENDIDAFNEILMKERKHIQAIEQVEIKRIEATEAWFEDHAPKAEDKTISRVIELVEDKEQNAQLEKLYDSLIYTLADLKSQEKLNRDLIEQSLQMVELSLDLMQPNHQKDLNYQKPKRKEQQSSSTSVFDSKA